MEKRKRTKNFAVHLPRHLAYSNIPTPKPTNNTANICTTHTVGIVWPIAPPTHPFEACIKVARNTGFAEGHVSRVLEVWELLVKLQLFERQIVQLEGQLRGSEKLEAEKTDLERHLCCHQETTNGMSNTWTPVNRTITVAAHVFHKFIPGAPFHPPIPHSTAMLPTSVIHFHVNSLPEWDKPQSQSKSPNPWSSLAICPTHHTRQQNHSFHTSIYKIPACRSTFVQIANALSLA